VGAEFVSEADLLARSDFVIPLFPLTPATTGFFNAARSGHFFFISLEPRIE